MKQTNCFWSRFIIPFTLVILISNQTYAQQKKQTDLEKEGLKGAVSEVEKKEWKAADRFGVTEKTNYILGHVKKFTQNGYLESHTSIDEQGQIMWKTIYKFDSKGLISESKTYRSDGYLESYWLYTYHPNGTPKEHTRFNASGKISVKSTFNDQGHWLAEMYFKDDGSVWYHRAMTYDDLGNLKEEKELFKSRTIKYRYDFRGNNTEQTWIYKDGEISVIKFEYDSFDRIVIKATYKNASQTSKAILQYNEQGDEKVYKSYNDSQNYFKNYEYKYDSKGNWIVKITYESSSEGFLGVPVKIEERKIKYYN